MRNTSSVKLGARVFTYSAIAPPRSTLVAPA
jgi:hypothetical protein